MTTFETVRIPSLAHGISHQPSHQRFPGQVEAAENASFDVADGCSKRPGSLFTAEITGLDAAEDYRVHKINRDATEQYLVIYGLASSAMTIKVLDVLDGVLATVNIDADAQAYLDAESAEASDLRLLTIADTTFIVNTKVTPLLETTPDYNVSLTHTDFTEMISYTPLVSGSYHQTLQDSSGAPAGYWRYTVDGITFPSIQCVADNAKNTVEEGEGGIPDDYTSTGGKTGTDPVGFKIAFRREDLALSGVSCDAAGLVLTKTGAFASLELVVDPGEDERARTQIYVDTGTGVTQGWYTIESIDSDDQITLATSCASGATADITTDGIRDEFEVEADLEFDWTGKTMHDIAQVLENALRQAGAQNATIGWLELGPRQGRFSIGSPYRGSAAEVFAPESPTGLGGTTLYDLTDDATNAVCPFAFVKAASSNTTGSGNAGGIHPTPPERWTRVAAPVDEDGAFDADTLPVKMVRTTKGSPDVFDVSLIDWNDRTSGTATSNPAPRLFTEGVPITAIAYSDDRLIFAGNEYVAMSQAGDLFNFFNSDFDNIVDSDPIDITVGGTSVSVLTDLMVFRDSITAFSVSGSQFEIGHAGGPLAPSTITVDEVSSYDMVDVRPAKIGDRIHFLSIKRNAGAMYEYFYSDRADEVFAFDVSAHAFDLLPRSLKSMTASADNSMTFVLPDRSNENDIFVYRFIVINDLKEQSAWTSYTFEAGAASSFKIKDIAAVESTLYSLIYTNPGGHFVTRMPMLRDNIDLFYQGVSPYVSPGYIIHLDNMRVATASVAGGTTTWNYQFDADIINRVVTADGTVLTPSSPGWSISGDEVSVTGEYGTAILGTAYDFSVTLTRPYVTAGDGQKNIQNAIGIKRIVVHHDDDTEYYTVTAERASPFSNRTRTYDKDVKEKRVMQALLNGNADDMTIKIENDSVRPCTITAVQFDVEVDDT